MTWIAIPFAAFTVLGTFMGGWVALRLAHSLPTVIALTGGIVVAVALFDVLPEALESVDDPAGDGADRRGLPRLLPDRATARPPPSRRPRPSPGPSAGGHGGGGRSIGPQLHRRARHRARVQPRHRRPACSSSSPSPPTTSPTASTWSASCSANRATGAAAMRWLADRCPRAAGRRDRRGLAERLRELPRARAGDLRAASSSTWGRPTCCRRLTQHASWARVGLTVAGFAADLRDHPDRRDLNALRRRRGRGPACRAAPSRRAKRRRRRSSPG